MLKLQFDFFKKIVVVFLHKGFDISDIMELDRVKVVAPPKLKKKQRRQFSVQENLLTRQVACARVHMERGIWRKIPILDQTVYVIEFISNFQKPVLKVPLKLWISHVTNFKAEVVKWHWTLYKQCITEEMLNILLCFLKLYSISHKKWQVWFVFEVTYKERGR